MGVDRLASTLAACSGVLFDFDGPVCDVFARIPASSVAKQLVQLVAERDRSLARALEGITDPLELLRVSGRHERSLMLRIEQALTDAEVEAVGVAGEPTPGAPEAVRAAFASGRAVAVVSNNSEDGVRAFLNAHALSCCVHEVIGRPEHSPERMKPDPYSVMRAAEALGVSPSDCVLIGDSTTDIEAARRAGAAAIGFANKPGKRETFETAGADAITADMRSIAEVLRAECSTSSLAKRGESPNHSSPK